MEGEFSVKISGIRQVAEMQNQVAKTMRQVESELHALQGSLSFEIAQKSRIRSRLRNAGNRIRNHHTGLNRAVVALQSIATLYEKTEAKISTKQKPDFDPRMCRVPIYGSNLKSQSKSDSMKEAVPRKGFPSSVSSSFSFNTK